MGIAFGYHSMSEILLGAKRIQPILYGPLSLIFIKIVDEQVDFWMDGQRNLFPRHVLDEGVEFSLS